MHRPFTCPEILPQTRKVDLVPSPISSVCSPVWTRSLLTLASLLLVITAPVYGQDRESIHKVPPIYPEMAKRMHITGTVKVIATVDPAGGVSNAISDSGNKVLAQAAIDAVKRWKFAPGQGTATVVVQINFDL